MERTVILTLKKIKYVGSSIGDDIQIEIEALNNFTTIDRKMQRGSTADFNTEIGRIVTNKKSLVTPVTIRVIEKDLLFNDVGICKKNTNINFDAGDSQYDIYEIAVSESRGYNTGKTARFEVTIEVRVFQGLIRYVEEEKGGWLNISPENKSEEVAIPKYLKLLLYGVDSKREYFTVLEGALQGAKASVILKNGISYLSSVNSHTEAVHISYSLSKKILKFQGKEYKAVDYPGVSWKKGLYDIEIPDHPHKGGRSYPDSQFATVWFRIGHTGDRYLHTGSRSAGCITLVEQKKWDQLCGILMRARKGDNVSVGVLEVVD